MFWVYVVFGVSGILGAIWGISSVGYLLSAYESLGFARIGPGEYAFMVMAVAIPILVLLFIAAIFACVIFIRENGKVMACILGESRIAGANLETVSKTLIEQKKLDESRHFFRTLEFVLSDVSSSLIAAIRATHMASDVVLFDAIGKNSDERLSSACRVVLDLRASTPHFEETLRRKLKKDKEAMAAAAEFAEKYALLKDALKKYDVDKVYTKVVENGDFGRVGEIFLKAMLSAPEAEEAPEPAPFTIISGTSVDDKN